jgi:hypothetical protein
MGAQNTKQNELTKQEIEAGINGEVVADNDNMLMIKINMQADADSNFVYVVVERHYRRLYPMGVGLTFEDAIYDTIRRAAQFDDVEGIEKAKGLEKARYQYQNENDDNY